MDNQHKSPTTPMNPEIKAQWVAALRSGEYKQGVGYLHRDDTFCCLGVLCDLAIKAGAPEVEENRHPAGSMSTYNGSELVLPSSVMEWAGLSSSDPILVDESREVNECLPVSEFNDSGVTFNGGGFTFNEIADLIEAQL